MDMKQINRKVIDQFRAGGQIEGMQRDRLILLTTVGARTGQRRTTPMMFHRDGSRLLVIASNVGAPRHPRLVPQPGGQSCRDGRGRGRDLRGHGGPGGRGGARAALVDAQAGLPVLR